MKLRIRRSGVCSLPSSLTRSLVSISISSCVSNRCAHSRLKVILSYVLQNSIQTVSVLVTGRLGPDELSAAAFSMMLAMVTGESSHRSLLIKGPRLELQDGVLLLVVLPHSTLWDHRPSRAETEPLCQSTSNAALPSFGCCSFPLHCSGLS